MDCRQSALLPGFGSQLFGLDRKLPGNKRKSPSSQTNIISAGVSESVAQLQAHCEIRFYADLVHTYLELEMSEFHSIVMLRQCDSLRRYHSSIFDNPPDDLFEIVKRLRVYCDGSDEVKSSVLEALRREVSRSPEDNAQGPNTAPVGYEYRCPSDGCLRSFNKWGHCKNHVNKWHSDYEKWHPGYVQQQHRFLQPKPLPTSPGINKNQKSRQRRTSSQGRIASRSMRPQVDRRDSDPAVEQTDAVSQWSPRWHERNSLGIDYDGSTWSGDYSRHSSQRSSMYQPGTPPGSDIFPFGHALPPMPESPTFAVPNSTFQHSTDLMFDNIDIAVSLYERS